MAEGGGEVAWRRGQGVDGDGAGEGAGPGEDGGGGGRRGRCRKSSSRVGWGQSRVDTGDESDEMIAQ